MKSEDISRRSFLKRAAALSAAAAIPSFWIPSKANAMPGVPFVSANEKVRIAFIGIGNRGNKFLSMRCTHIYITKCNHFAQTGFIQFLCDLASTVPESSAFPGFPPDVRQDGRQDRCCYSRCT